MTRLRPVFFVGIFICFASVGLSRFGAAHVRAVDAMGLWASGMGCGAAVYGFVTAIVTRTSNVNRYAPSTERR